MAKFSKYEVIRSMSKTGVVPLFYDSNIDNCKKIVEACYNGGARLLEFTARGDFAHEVFGELSKFISIELPEMIIGVGSVTDAASASLYMSLGANFVVTPVLREDIAIVCNRRKLLWSAGCGSLTEIAKAEELGCDIVKLFPGQIYGPKFVKGVKGPQPWTNIMPTGGVSPTKENLKEWFDSGVTCVGIGSNLITKINGSYDFDKIQMTTKKTIDTIKEIRSYSNNF